MAVRKDEVFYFGTFITIRVEDTLFQVPRENLEEQSEVFRDMFTLPIGEHSEADGRSDEQPLLLEGVSVTEFRSFLTLLLPRLAPGGDISLSDKDLDACLRLTKMWCFDDLRDVVINKLGRLNLTPSRKLELARTHDIRCWYRSALKELASCSSALTPDNIAQIGPKLALMVYRLKDKKLEVIVNSGFNSMTKNGYISGRRIEEYNMKEIQREFGILLDNFAQAYHWDDCSTPA